MSRTPRRFPDDHAHDLARQYLDAVAGNVHPPVTWDPEHHLQGHVEIDGRHVVLIAPRDDDHSPRVLTEAEWDELRRGSLTAA